MTTFRGPVISSVWGLASKTPALSVAPLLDRLVARHGLPVRMLGLLLIPLLGLSVATALNIAANHATATRMDRLGDVVLTAGVAGDLADALQREAEASARILPGQGAADRNELTVARDTTARAAEALTRIVHGTPADGALTTAGIARNALFLADQIGVLRQGIDAGTVSPREIANYFTVTVLRLLDVGLGFPPAEATGPAAGAAAYAYLQQWKEAVCATRAAVGDRDRMIRGATEQDLFRKLALTHATPTQRAFLERAVARAEVEEADRLIRIAVATAPGGVSVDATAWNRAMSAYVERLRGVERRLYSDLRDEVTNAAANARSAMMTSAVIGGSLIAITLALGWFLLRSLAPATRGHDAAGAAQDRHPPVRAGDVRDVPPPTETAASPADDSELERELEDGGPSYGMVDRLLRELDIAKAHLRAGNDTGRAPRDGTATIRKATGGYTITAMNATVIPHPACRADRPSDRAPPPGDPDTTGREGPHPLTVRVAAHDIGSALRLLRAVSTPTAVMAHSNDDDCSGTEPDGAPDGSHGADVMRSVLRIIHQAERLRSDVDTFLHRVETS